MKLFSTNISKLRWLTSQWSLIVWTWELRTVCSSGSQFSKYKLETIQLIDQSGMGLAHKPATKWSHKPATNWSHKSTTQWSLTLAPTVMEIKRSTVIEWLTFQSWLFKTQRVVFIKNHWIWVLKSICEFDLKWIHA